MKKGRLRQVQGKVNEGGLNLGIELEAYMV